MPSTLTYLGRIWTGATRGAIAVAAIVVIIVIVRDLTGDILTIEPINLPRSLIRSGLTPEIVAARFQIQLAAYERGAHTTMRGPGLDVSGSANDAVSDIVVPGTGLSIGGLTGWIGTRLLTPSIRALLHLPPQRRITGEIIEFSSGRYRLYLHSDGELIALAAPVFTADEFDVAIGRASQDLALRLIPFQYAAYLFFEGKTDDARLREILTRIMTTSSHDDESVARAHNMLGNMLLRRDEFAGAQAEFELSNYVAEHAGIADFDVAYLNLANVDMSRATRVQQLLANPDLNPEARISLQTERSRLIHEARGYAALALAKRPSNGDIYVVLGRIHAMEGLDEAAQEYYDTAISLPRPSYSAIAYWYRGDLEFKTRHYHQAEEDQTEYLTYRTKETPNIKGLAAEYLRLHDFLIHEIDPETATAQETRTNIPATDIITATYAWGLHLDVLGYSDLPDQTHQSEASILQTSCDALRMVVRLWNRGDTDRVDPVTVISDLADLAKRQRSEPNAPRSPCYLQRPVPTEQ